MADAEAIDAISIELNPLLLLAVLPGGASANDCEFPLDPR